MTSNIELRGLSQGAILCEQVRARAKVGHESGINANNSVGDDFGGGKGFGCVRFVPRCGVARLFDCVTQCDARVWKASDSDQGTSLRFF